MTDTGYSAQITVMESRADQAVSAATAGDAHQFAFQWSQSADGIPLRWRVEQEDPARTYIGIDEHTLTLDAAAGLTVWLDQPLSGGYRISYLREVLLQGQPNDRLSDLNQFWAARDPARTSLFTRHGELSEYDNLALYYVGMGGNWNSTTRFRYYNGQGERQLLGEFTDEAHLLRAGRRYRVTIEVDSTETRFLIDNQLYFRAHYAEPPANGYFGLRMVFSRQTISDFSVTPL
ncbi:DUF6250 domain-containing protein [Dickeya chrysanthemi]|uniref:DUF6250 domain-containing protein n=1 Tax=Dickeya chrysanthemi TaxID=556 RepID=A0ABU8JR47_DICCH|nr:DUF6250 domain-containing protein [Dickeya chrysanthemi]MBX9446984.1 hypothetical protein [Dickeya chrysanthemi]MCA7005764.1 DUF6250 domain-containing protein [Dickeya chrysanthemi]